MKKYISLPFEFDKLIKPKERLKRLDLVESIHSNIQFLIFSKVGDSAYDRNMGFEIWDYDRNVFYREKTLYFQEDGKDNFKGTLESNRAKDHFTNDLQNLIVKYEPRLENIDASFSFERLRGKYAEYQRQMVIEVKGRIRSTGLYLDPPVKIRILYSPFKVEKTTDPQ
ncbi:MAG: hypothetical protein KDD99_06665 [Bacteroidetes bacterium]|nr:hypothetical protein [Bacteroidota bacterium]